VILGPQRIVCLTEETTEWIYLLGQESRIVGISGYTVRPRRAREEKPKVSAFLSAKIDKILDLRPDCVLGFSDLQADIASQLIRAGVQVTIFNQRSVREIYSMLYQVGAMLGCATQAANWITERHEALKAMQDRVKTWQSEGKRLPLIYFEEWDEPQISAILWVSQLIRCAGGIDIFPELARESLGKNRIISDGQKVIARAPDIIIGSWCGKKFRPEKVASRPDWDFIPAVREGHLYEIKSADILQPGPAALTDGVAQLHRIIAGWVAQHESS
jgi:iron complex transport system substrate-binding protein